MNEVFLAFVPIFFAMDPVGLLPLFIGLTQGLARETKRRIVFEAILTATSVAVGFIWFGQVIFKFLGITMGDFQVAGGVLLFCFSILDLTKSGHSDKGALEDVGAVPIGTPLIVGPAVLTMCLISTTQHGVGPTLAAVLLNIVLTAVLFFFSEFFIRLISPSGARILSKVLAILLAAIGVMMVRRGLVEIMSSLS